jgi:hypothetical protein
VVYGLADANFAVGAHVVRIRHRHDGLRGRGVCSVPCAVGNNLGRRVRMGSGTGHGSRRWWHSRAVDGGGNLAGGEDVPAPGLAGGRSSMASSRIEVVVSACIGPGSASTPPRG